MIKHNINLVLCVSCILAGIVIGGISMLIVEIPLRAAFLTVGVLNLLAATYFFARFYKSVKDKV